MKYMSVYPFFGFIIFMILLWTVGIVYGIDPDNSICPSTSVMIIGICYGLYFGTFNNPIKPNMYLINYRLKWLQDVVLICGFLSLMTGLNVMTSFEQPEYGVHAISSGIATTLISLFYAIIGFGSYYFVEKYLSFVKNENKFEPQEYSNGLNIQSIVGLIISNLLFLFSIWVAASIHNKIIPNVSSTNTIIFVMGLLILSVLIQKRGKGILILLIPFWKIKLDEKQLMENLKILRNAKRIILLLCLIFTLTVPIIILHIFGSGNDLSMLSPLHISANLIMFTLIDILFLLMAEGQLVQQIYYKTGKVKHENRINFILFLTLPIIFWFFSLLIFTFVYFGMWL